MDIAPRLTRKLQSHCATSLRALLRPISVSMANRPQGYLLSFTRTRRTLPNAAFSTSSRRRFALATEQSPSPPPAPHTPVSNAAATDPKITQIVDDISGLTLLQAADLVTLLKSRLNIQEIAMPAAAPSPAAAAASAEEAPAEEKPKEKTIFNVMLESFDAGAKAKVIREVKALVPNLTLIDAKKFVESLPKILKENLSKEEADKLKVTFEAVGAVIKLE